MDRKKYPRGEEEPLKILRRKIRSAKNAFHFKIKNSLHNIFSQWTRKNLVKASIFTWRRNHSHYEKKANERGTTNLHLNWLILFSAIKMLSRGAISQLKFKRLNKSSNGSVSPTVERLRCYYRCSDLWTSLFHIFRFNKRDTAIKRLWEKTFQLSCI